MMPIEAKLNSAPNAVDPATATSGDAPQRQQRSEQSVTDQCVAHPDNQETQRCVRGKQAGNHGMWHAAKMVKTG
jgi:hypothetical protein